MTKVKAIWAFVAGESRWAPAGAGLAIVAAFLALRYLPSGAETAGPVFVACIAAGLVAGVFEHVGIKR